MKTIKKVLIEPVFVYYMPEDMEEGKLYISEEFDTCIHKCLCGCGNKVHTPLGNNGWKLTKHDKGKVSLSPSILSNQIPCNSHYIITKNVANFV